MPLNPTPTSDEIEQVREIALLYSYAQSQTLINALNDAQWAATLADLAAWAAVKNKHTRIEGDGVKIDKDRNRLDITNRVSRRLGLTPAADSNDSGGGGSYAVYTPPIFKTGCGEY